MKDITPPPIVDHDPHAKMRPKPMSRTRRVVCFLFGAGLALAGLYAIGVPLDNGKGAGRMVIAGFFMLFGAIVLVGSALFPNFTLAREHLDRRRRG